MEYIDGFVAAVPDANRSRYIAYATQMGAVFREHGALRLVECWGDDVPDGKLTSFPMAVQRAAGESVIFSWVVWPSRAVRDAGWQTVMEDPRMNDPDNPMPFDGKRMIYGGFQMVVDA